MSFYINTLEEQKHACHLFNLEPADLTTESKKFVTN
jgi:hypothetical protein